MSRGEGTVRCPGCGGLFPDVEGPTHAYMTSVPGGWAAFGGGVGREFSGWWIGEVHRLVVDCYAAQHPGDAARKASQSVALHLIALHLTLDRGVPHETVTRVLQLGARGPAALEVLAPPTEPGWRTVLDVLPARSLEEHEELVRAWAASVWAGWAPRHDDVATWATELLRRL